MIKYLENNLLSEISEGRVLVDFYADWCGPCKMMSEMLNKINDIKIIKVNVDKYMDLAQQYGVMSIPTLILFDNGNLIRQHVGMMSLNELNDFIK